MRWLALVALAISAAAAAGQSRPDAAWVGVWQAELDGQVSVVITLGNDPGAVGGTIVFNVVAKKDGPAYILGRDAHVMTNTRLAGDDLAFEVFRHSDGRDLHLTMHRNADDTAELECTECGSPKVTLARIK